MISTQLYVSSSLLSWQELRVWNIKNGKRRLPKNSLKICTICFSNYIQLKSVCIYDFRGENFLRVSGLSLFEFCFCFLIARSHRVYAKTYSGRAIGEAFV